MGCIQGENVGRISGPTPGKGFILLRLSSKIILTIQTTTPRSKRLKLESRETEGDWDPLALAIYLFWNYRLLLCIALAKRGELSIPSCAGPHSAICLLFLRFMREYVCVFMLFQQIVQTTTDWSPQSEFIITNTWWCRRNKVNPVKIANLFPKQNWKSALARQKEPFFNRNTSQREDSQKHCRSLFINAWCTIVYWM